ncbi:hypothetical protein F4802DRAFT_595317 [Xylaria palmicola]|nr:hypothetical protein F4802DRAFT_595317 [Xylaria palmicola]
MSGSGHQVPTSEGDVWTEKAAVIRQLYLHERKTLKQVKAILESEHGFPVHSLSKYETNIRDKLRLRKKLKRRDWPTVYHHYRNRAGKETDIYLCDVKLPWEKAWKEIQRSGGRSLRDGQPGPLPHDLVLRTPSPVIPPMSPSFQGHQGRLPSVFSPSVPALFMAQDEALGIGLQNAPGISDPPMLSTCGGLNNLPLVQYTGRAGSEAGVVAGTHDSEVSFYREFLYTTPWNQFKKNILSIVSDIGQPLGNLGRAHGSLFDQDNFADFTWFSPGFLVQLAASSIAPSLPRVGGSSTALALDFSTYFVLGKFLYLLSNKIDIQRTPTANKEVSELFFLIFDRLPTGFLLKLFDSDLSSMRAAWETLVFLAKDIDHKGAFTFLMKIGLQNIEWVLPIGHKYLSCAVSMGCIDIVRALLRAGVRADDKLGVSRQFWKFNKPAILEAVVAEDYDTAKELIQGCDMNRGILKIAERWMSNFEILISTIGVKRFYHRHRPTADPSIRQGNLGETTSLNDGICSRVLDIFLDSGANVDLLWRGFSHTDLSRLHHSIDMPMEWKMSLLDQCFYAYRGTGVYERLRLHSRKEGVQITRPGICLSAKRGAGFLQAYLDSRPIQHPADRKRLLELILVEQFFIHERPSDLEIIRGLIDFGVDINLPHIRFGPSVSVKNSIILLNHLVKKSCLYGFTSGVADLVTFMVDKGAIINSDVLAAAVAKAGLGVLPELARHGADVRAEGGLALCMAARWNNFEAVSWLLQAGVDINADVHRESWGMPLAIIAIALSYDFHPFEYPILVDSGCRSANIEMLGFLVRRGARVRLNSQNPSGFHLLKDVLDSGRDDFSLLSKVEFCLDFLAVPEDLASAQETSMELFAKFKDMDYSNNHHILATYELLFRRGCPVVRESGLVFYISSGGRHDLIFEILDAGADVNACASPSYPIQAAAQRGDLELVIQLVQRGAIINQPALGFWGRTALQGACEWTALSMEERSRQVQLIKYLINQGAYVNAPAAYDCGRTALQIAALYGDVEIVLLLLEHDALINAPPVEFAGNWYSALDLAASEGRLDMVKILLNTGAHSHYRGETGYQGAIDAALKNHHFAVAALIEEHIKLFGNCIIVEDSQLYLA